MQISNDDSNAGHRTDWEENHATGALMTAEVRYIQGIDPRRTADAETRAALAVKAYGI